MTPYTYNNYISPIYKTTNEILQNQQKLYDSITNNIEQYKHTYKLAGLDFIDECERTHRLLGLDQREKLQKILDPFTKVIETTSSIHRTLVNQSKAVALEPYQQNSSLFNQTIDIVSQYGFSEIIESFANYNFSTESILQRERLTVDISWKILSDVEDKRSLQDKLKLIHPAILFVIILSWQIIFTQFNCALYSRFTQPLISSYLLDNNNVPNREKINSIKKLPFTFNDINSKTFQLVSNNLRFITGDNVRLRKSPSTSSKILDELIFGQIVKVLSKKKNWIQVEYNYDEGDVLQGWVFTRYTAKFKKI